jgi:ABC-2 type transport system ATP-binding protein
MTITDDISTGTATVTGTEAVHMDGVTKSYGTTPAVRGIDLVVAPGEIVALLGPNGAGKSTTIDMLLGLTTPDRGTVHIFGRPPATACAEGRVGAMLQSGDLPTDFTVLEVVDLMRALYPTALSAAEVLDRAGIADLAGRPTTALSGGQSQRVRFALAIVPDPQLMVLDEPTAAMDVERRQGFWAHMRQWAACGRTVLFATHYLEEADEFADRIVLLGDGRVVADGATTEIRGMSTGRMLRCTLDQVDAADLERLPGVSRASVHGHGVSLTSSDSDATVRALLARYPDARDIEITGAGLNETFLTLTASPKQETHT